MKPPSRQAQLARLPPSQRSMVSRLFAQPVILPSIVVHAVRSYTARSGHGG